MLLNKTNYIPELSTRPTPVQQAECAEVEAGTGVAVRRGGSSLHFGWEAIRKTSRRSDQGSEPWQSTFGKDKGDTDGEGTHGLGPGGAGTGGRGSRSGRPRLADATAGRLPAAGHWRQPG